MTMNLFVARQPIFDTHGVVYGYELLFRDGLNAGFPKVDPDAATSQIIAESPALIGLESMTGGRKAFVNITRDLLLSESTTLLPPHFTVLEILESVAPDDDALRACRAMKAAGFQIALDDFTPRDRGSRLVEVADIVKVDFLLTASGELSGLVRELKRRGVRILAEKLETEESHREALGLGFDLFQGYFFSKPMLMSSRCIPGVRLQYLQVLREIQRPEIDLGFVERVIKNDLSLSYRLLRHLGSAYYAARDPVHSIRQALMVLGEREIRKWVSVVALANLAGDRPQELVAQAMVRARLCEELATVAGLAGEGEDCFLMGMFSLVDAIIGCPLEQALTGIRVSDEVRDSLLSNRGRLRPLLDYVQAWESGDWHRIASLTQTLGIPEADVPQMIRDALSFAADVQDPESRAA